MASQVQRLPLAWLRLMLRNLGTGHAQDGCVGLLAAGAVPPAGP